MHLKLLLGIVLGGVFFAGALALAEDGVTTKVNETVERSGNTTVRTRTETVITKDTDGDGLWDTEDPHPSVPEIFIVKDDNANGIVDSFESIGEKGNL